jgi:hypothetical protein
MRIYVFPDPRGVGQAVAKAAIKRGHDLVTQPAFGEVGYVRTMNYGEWRALSLGMLSNLHDLAFATLPSYQDSLLYDDKVEQLPVLSRWLPKTHVIHNAPGVVVRPKMDLPFISKTASGSASKNVRIIRTQADADAEWKAAFGGEGIYCISAGRKSRQRGYLYWQEFIPDNPYDIRVVVNGDHLYGLRRFNRSEDQPFASGSGKLEPIHNLLYKTSVYAHRDEVDHLRRSFQLAHEISLALGTRWACYDFVRDWKKGVTYVLEVSFSWTEPAYAQCPCFDRVTLEPNGRTAQEWPEFAVDEMERSLRQS